MWFLRSFFILAALIWLPVNVASAKFPGAYTGPAKIQDMALSPGGQYIATLKQAETKYGAIKEWDIINITRSDPNAKQKPYFEENRFFYGINWISDDLLIAPGREYFRMKRRYGSREIILTINPETGKETKIFEAENGKDSFLDFKILKYNKSTREIAVIVPIGKSKILRIINADTGEARDVAVGSSKTLYWVLDDKMIPLLRFDQGKHDNVETVYRRGGKKDKWIIFNEIDTKELQVNKVAFDPDAEKFLVITRPEKAQRRGVYSWGPSDPENFDLVYEHDRFDIQEIEISRHTKDMTYAAWWEDKYERKWFDVDAQNKAFALESKLGTGKNWTIVDTSEDLNVWMIYVSAPKHPGSVQIWKPGSQSLHVFEEIRPELSVSDLSERRVVKYTAQDGLQLTGYFTPSGKGNKDKLVVIPHGGPVARDYQDWDGWAQYLSYKGFSVWQPNFRGSGGYGRAFEEKGHGEWGKKMQSDIEDGVTHLESHGMIDKTSHRGIVGASYGGYAALTAAYKTPDRYKCVVSINGLSDLPTFLEKFDHKEPYEKKAYDIWVQRMGDPKTDKSILMQASPIHNIDAMTARILLVHGERDNIVPISQSQSFATAAKSAGKKVQFQSMPKVGHNNWSERTSTNVLTDLDTFLLMCMR